MPHNQWQPTGTLSTVTHRCRYNEISNITFPWWNSVNLFVWMNILAITIQQICSYKTLLVWNIWQNVSQTFHKTPSYGPGSQLWLANGRDLYLTPTTEFPTWYVEGVSAGTGSWRASVVCHRGGIPQGVSQLNKGTFILNRVMLYTKIISHKVSATRDRYVNVPKVIWQQVH